MKKLILLFTCLMAVTTSLWAYDFSAVCETGQTLYYNINSDGTSVTVTYPGIHYSYYDGHSKPTGDLVIPSSVTNNGKTYSVTSIGYPAFLSCTGLTSVTIPNSVTSIEYDAFADCSGLTSVTIGNSVKSIGNWAFKNCTGLTSITIPNSVTSIGQEAFYGTGWWNNQSNGIIYKNGWCLGYKGEKPEGALTIQNGTKGIADFAFYRCTGLTSVTIPSSVTSIGNCAFNECTGLTTVNFNADSCTTMGEVHSYYRDGEVHIYYQNPVFKDCSNLTTINIGDNVKIIPDFAFFNCKGLSGALTIPESVTSIGDSAFYCCEGLTGKLTIPNSVTSIGGGAFKGCSGFTGPLTIPNSVTTIEDHAFYGCSGLTGTLTIPNSVTTIGHYAFCGCRGFTGPLIIPNSVTTIRSYAFYHCTGLTSVTIPNSVTSIWEQAFSKCTGLTSVTIPSSVTSIRNSAFSYCTGLTSVTIPNSVTSIGNGVFLGCTGLTGTLTIPTSVTSIGDYVFKNCTGLTSVTIPKSVTSIGEYAFSSCSGLTEITCEAVTPPNIAASAFDSYSAMLYVPKESTQTYRNHKVWGKFAYPYIVTVISSNENMGTVTGSGTYKIGKKTTISAKPQNGYKFVNWSDGSTENPRIVSDEVNLIAYFEELASYTLTLNVNDSIMGSVSGAGTYYEGTVVTITAIPKSGYKFVSWNDGNTGKTRAITITDNVTYTVTFEELSTFTIAVSANDFSMGNVDGGGDFKENSNITLIATPNNGYKFVQWNDGNTDNPRSVIVTEDATYIATFAATEGRDGIAETSANAIQIFSDNHSIIINNAANANVAIYDVVGRTVVKEQRLNSNKEVFAMPRRGVYIVCIAKTAKKVLVK